MIPGSTIRVQRKSLRSLRGGRCSRIRRLSAIRRTLMLIGATKCILLGLDQNTEGQLRQPDAFNFNSSALERVSPPPSSKGEAGSFYLFKIA